MATSRISDWQPITLVLFLAGIAIASDVMAIETKTLRMTGSFIALVLAMALLGPGPAVAIGLLTIAIAALRDKTGPMVVFTNVVAYATFPLIGGLAVRVLDIGSADGATFALAVSAVFGVVNIVNFLMIAIPLGQGSGRSIWTDLRRVYVPILPSEALAAALAVASAATYRAVGLPALVAVLVALFLFQVLTRELLLSQERGVQLEARSTQLASLQVGVLAALVQTLSLRDRMTARHSAAVARYARAIADEVGCTTVEQELVHTAGLLHDIGKFAFPDRILLANRKLDDDDWKIVRTHPYQGARLVRRINGYGPVAEIILAHHERIDGRGYPRGLTGEEIPMLSRMISIADTYDVMTARDSYRDPVSQAEAIAELRRVSGAQLDGDLVEAFIRVLERSRLQFQHTTDADFERELDFDARVRGYALPQAA
ncbi:HD domain-containing phosphohydrolase [Baekduia alba]|uniref:HD domain-containing phosphohydrolase n=1 Tax=Baekduia alba TaxID=2997333 RepID=UPI002341AA84|nr:HD domain-containing phosphohydrolase [Baekduia alba]